MELRYPWLRLEFFGLVDECRDPRLGIVAHESRESARGLRLRAERMVEDLWVEDEGLVGGWCYDLEEAEHVRKVAECLHAVLSGDWSAGEIVAASKPAWARLAEAAQAAWIAFARRGMPPCDFESAKAG